MFASDDGVSGSAQVTVTDTPPPSGDNLALNQPALYEGLGWQPLFQIADPFLYFSVWAFLVAFCLVVVISFVTKPEPEQKTRYVVFGGLGDKKR